MAVVRGGGSAAAVGAVAQRPAHHEEKNAPLFWPGAARKATCYGVRSEMKSQRALVAVAVLTRCRSALFFAAAASLASSKVTSAAPRSSEYESYVARNSGPGVPVDVSGWGRAKQRNSQGEEVRGLRCCSRAPALTCELGPSGALRDLGESRT